jgi:hypothetical protein
MWNTQDFSKAFFNTLCHQILNYEAVNPFAGSNPGDNLPIMTILRKGNMNLIGVPTLNTEGIETPTQITF